MSRTQAERDANDMIDAAIEAYREAYRAAHPEATHGVLGAWIVVASETVANMEDPEDDVTAYSIIMANGAIPSYQSYGLLAIGKRFIDMYEDS
jgi:hypothetical protein